MTTKPVSQNWRALQAKLKGDKTMLGGDDTRQNGKVWFDVDEKDLQRSRLESSPPRSLLDLFPPPRPGRDDHDKPGRFLGIDCEYVGVGPGGVDSALARITVVNWHGRVVMDLFVRPLQPVTDYRTTVSGVRPTDLRNAVSLSDVQKKLQAMIQSDTIIVGHGLRNDFRVLLFTHPRRLIRDTTRFRRFRAIARGRTPALKRLAKEFLGVEIQMGEHDSAEDARAAVLLYRQFKAEWENALFRQEGKKRKAEKRAKKREE